MEWVNFTVPTPTSASLVQKREGVIPYRRTRRNKQHGIKSAYLLPGDYLRGEDPKVARRRRRRRLPRDSLADWTTRPILAPVRGGEGRHRAQVIIDKYDGTYPQFFF